MKKIFSVALILITSATAFAQKGTDTVVVNLAKTSRMVFTIKDKSDLEKLKQYDFQAMFDDILTKLEKNDSVIVIVDSVKTEVVTDASENTAVWENEPSSFSTDYDDNDDDRHHDHGRRHRTTHSFNLDMGLSNYLESGKFPDEEGEQYAVRPWGSWAIGLSSVQRTTLSKGFYLEWALGVSWYNFKFLNDNTVVVKGDSEVSFEEDFNDVSFVKSRMQVTYINVSAIPMFSVGEHRKNWKWKSYSSGFRIGAGPYVGYRVGSSTKQVYKENDDKQKIKNHDNFYLENLRYGVRLQIGVRSADFFLSYDINELFAAGQGPKLNAISFGVTF